jgi:hypothetical protein
MEGVVVMACGRGCGEILLLLLQLVDAQGAAAPPHQQPLLTCTITLQINLPPLVYFRPQKKPALRSLTRLDHKSHGRRYVRLKYDVKKVYLEKKDTTRNIN